MTLVQRNCDFLFLFSAVRIFEPILSPNHQVIGIHHLAVLTETLLAHYWMHLSWHTLVPNWYAVRMLHCLSPARPAW